MHTGVPTLMIDGRPTAALAYMTFNLDPKYVWQFAEAGVDLFSFETTCDYDYYGLAADARPAADRWDYSQFDQRMQMILGAAPRALVFPRIYICSPPWWDDAHRDQLMAGRGGVYDPAPSMGWLPKTASEKALAPRKMTVPSFSSRAWLETSGDALQRFLRYAEKTYPDRIIGYHLAGGGSQEWYYWGAFEDVFPDTSQPQQDAFRRWLRRRRWVGVRDTEVPPARERVRAEFGEFRDPSELAAARVINYLRFHSEALVDALSHFANVARTAIGPDKLLGVFYGYFVDLARHPTAWHSSGHLAIQKFLADPNIDFVSSPTAYKDRRAVRGYSLFNSLTESVTNRGKLWWSENDLLTPSAPDLKDPLFLKPGTPLESRHMQRREFANVLCHGAGSWWFDMWGGYHDSPDAMADIARMAAVGRRAVHADRSPVAEICVVLDDDSIHFLRCDNRLTSPLVADQLIALGHVGAPFSVIHVDDLAAVRRHRFYLFLNLFCAGDARLKMVREVAGAGGVTSLWFYAPGLAGDKLSVRRMADLTGIRLALETRAAPLRVRTPADGLVYGTASALAPVVWSDDPEAEVLGVLTTGGRPGLVRKRIGGAVSIFSAAPAMPASLLRQLAADAGVHIYASGGEVVYANRSFLALAAEPGSQPLLRLPEPQTLFDLFEEAEVNLPAGAAPLPVSVDGTWLFWRGTRSQWRALGT
jgi:hypothetical protein